MKQELKQLLPARTSRRAISTLIGFCIPLVLGWYAGYDMLERGSEQAFCLTCSFGLAVIVWTCPIWPKEQRNGQ